MKSSPDSTFPLIGILVLAVAIEWLLYDLHQLRKTVSTMAINHANLAFRVVALNNPKAAPIINSLGPSPAENILDSMRMKGNS